MKPKAEPDERRALYFTFQGLYMAVLLLLAIFPVKTRPSDGLLAFLAAGLAASLAFVRLVPAQALGRWWFHGALIVADAVAASVVLRWTSPRADYLFLMYLFLLFGSALARGVRQRAALGGIALALYLLSGWHPRTGWPVDSEYWLRAVFLAVSSALLAVLARDARRSEEEQRRRYEERLVQVGRLATLGRVAGEVAHRIKGPLTTIAVDAEVLSKRLKDAEAQRELAEIVSEVARCKTILKDLLDLGRIEEMDVAPLDLRDPLRSAVESLRSQARRRSIRLLAPAPERPMRVKGDPTLLREALSALLQNALDAVAEKGRVRVEAAAAGGFQRVSVSDDGVGIAPAELESIFEPFFTTKKGQGSGLGLSAALRIAAKHGGTIEVESDGPGRGARFTLVIPAA